MQLSLRLPRSLGLFTATAVLAVCLFHSTAFASEFSFKGPLALRNQNPIYLQFLNIEPTRAVTLAKGEYAVRLNNAYSNVFERGFGNGTEVLMDMELLRTSLSFNAGIYEKMEVGLEIPFLHFNGGYFDSFLQDYHNSFGFPNGGREQVANGGFTYRFLENGSAIYETKRRPFGLGDINVNFKHNFIEESNVVPAVAWLFYFKFPTGKMSEGLGSGNPDFGYGAALEKGYGRWRGYLNLGYFVAGGIDPLKNYLNNEYFSYVLGGEVCVTRPISIVAQINGGSPILKSAGMTQLDSFPMDLQIGVKGKYSNNVSWQAGFSEDLNANGPSVDITILASVGYSFMSLRGTK